MRPHPRPERVVENGFEILPREECLRLLAQHQRGVGRIAFDDGSGPVILPVNYAMVEDRIVLRTDPGSKLDAAHAAGVVAFEIDEIDHQAKSGWDVLVRGRADVVRSEAEQRSLTASGVRPWAGGDRSNWIMVWPTSITGRRLHHPAQLFQPAAEAFW